MITTTIVNQKGGVCKTTICRNLGYLLSAHYHKRVLLIDLDSSGNLSNFFRLRLPDSDDTGTARVVGDLDESPADHIFHTAYEGLDLMPANKALGRTEREIKSDDLLPQQNRLSLQLQKIASDYDYCLIDCPPTVTNAVLVINALVSSDDVVIPCPANMDAIDGVEAIVEMVEKIRKFYNPKISIRGVVYCRISRKSLDKQLLAQKLAIPRFRVYIREASALAEYSRVEGKSFYEYDPNSKGTHDMSNFAAEYLRVEFPFPDELPGQLGEYL